MNHVYIPSQLTPNVCSVCKRPEPMHAAVAQCESCNSVAKVEYYLATDTVMCWECKDKELGALLAACAPKERGNVSITSSMVDSIKEIHRATVADVNVPANQVAFVFQQKLMAHVDRLSKEKFELENKLNSINHELRQYKSALLDQGSELRAEIREQIRKNDSTYQPAIPAVKTPGKAPSPRGGKKHDVMEDLITGYMDVMNVSRQMAVEAIVGKGKTSAKAAAKG